MQLDKKPAIAICKLDPSRHLTSQNDHLMPEYRILRTKPTPRLERRSQDRQDEAEQFQHAALTLGDSFS